MYSMYIHIANWSADLMGILPFDTIYVDKLTKLLIYFWK